MKKKLIEVARVDSLELVGEEKEGEKGEKEEKKENTSKEGKHISRLLVSKRSKILN